MSAIGKDDKNSKKWAFTVFGMLRIIEKERNKKKDFNVFAFTLNDYGKLFYGQTFFEFIKAKKLEMQIALSYNYFINDNNQQNVVERIYSLFRNE